MQRPNAIRINLDLFYDYRTNVALYPTWQALLRDRQPKTIFFWGQDDFFFTPEGGEAYLKDLRKAEMRRLDAGHFAVEDHLDYISSNIHRFHAERASGGWEFTERERIHHSDAEGANGVQEEGFLVRKRANNSQNIQSNWGSPLPVHKRSFRIC